MPSRRTRRRSTEPTPQRVSRQSNTQRTHHEDPIDPEVYGSGSEFTSTTSSYTSMASMEMTSGRRKYDNYRPDEYNHDEHEEEEIYVVRQSHGYFAILFSLVQTIILAIMMWQCGIAPIKLK